MHPSDTWWDEGKFRFQSWKDTLKEAETNIFTLRTFWKKLKNWKDALKGVENNICTLRTFVRWRKFRFQSWKGDLKDVETNILILRTFCKKLKNWKDTLKGAEINIFTIKMKVYLRFGKDYIWILFILKYLWRRLCYGYK